jgi:hypothetical protein
MRRYLRALVIAYATSVTLLAAWWAMQAWSYRRFVDATSQPGEGTPVVRPDLRSLFLDFGIGLSPWESLAVRFADLGALTVVALISLNFAACLGIASMAGRPSGVGTATSGGGRSASLRWASRGALASLVVGASAFIMTWAFVRWRVLHPHPWPTVVLFVAQGAAAAVGSAAGIWGVVRGPRRSASASLAVAALVPLALWGLIGLYAWAQWRQRLVPNDLPMNLAKMAGSSLIRLEASVEYPNRLETDRLVMFYDRLGDPRRDAEKMDRHLARMEKMLGGPLRSKVFWVRGRLRRLDLGSLSVHGIALGSDESPEDWDTGGQLDRHELAHAALDEYRAAGADPPYFLHEGWAESRSGVGSVVLARRALEQRATVPSLGIREMAGREWYHHDAGPVYPLGGAFVDFLIRRDGVEKFVRLYNGSREGRFGAVVRAVYGADLDAIEAEFWEDTQEQANPRLPPGTRR